MATIRMACTGFSIGEWRVPAFELRTDEVVTLNLPRDFYCKSPKLCTELISALSGKSRIPGLTLHGRAAWAGPALSPRGVRRLFLKSSASSWLRRNTGMSSNAAEATVERLRLPIDDLNRLAGNPRTMLGLEAAWANGAEIIIFSTAGCDPKGISAAIQAVRDHLSICSAIHLSYGQIHMGETTSLVFPGSSVVEITRQSPVTV